MKIEICKLTCKRCGHIWRPRKEEVRICPSCKSPYFDRPKRTKNGSKEGKKERKKKHGLTKTAFYQTWTNMKKRCFYLKDKKFKYYGGRGITVCPRWLIFLNFRDDMYADYLKHKAINSTTTIDRLNSDENYCPENCCWATMEEQRKPHPPNDEIYTNSVQTRLDVDLYESLKALAIKQKKTLANMFRTILKEYANQI